MVLIDQTPLLSATQTDRTLVGRGVLAGPGGGFCLVIVKVNSRVEVEGNWPPVHLCGFLFLTLKVQKQAAHCYYYDS